MTRLAAIRLRVVRVRATERKRARRELVLERVEPSVLNRPRGRFDLVCRWRRPEAREWRTRSGA
jgi:hypothetical protein